MLWIIFTTLKRNGINPGQAILSNMNMALLSKSLSSGITLIFCTIAGKTSLTHWWIFCEFLYRVNSSYLGSDYKWTNLNITVKKYINFSNVRHRTLAFWGLYWGNWGELPYLNLPGTALDYTGWTGRGY